MQVGALSVFLGCVLVLGAGLVWRVVDSTMHDCSLSEEGIATLADDLDTSLSALVAGLDQVGEASVVDPPTIRRVGEPPQTLLRDGSSGSCVAGRVSVRFASASGRNADVAVTAWFYDSEADLDAGRSRISPIEDRQAKGEEANAPDWRPLDNSAPLTSWARGSASCMTGTLETCHEWAAWGQPGDGCSLVYALVGSRDGEAITQSSALDTIADVTDPLRSAGEACR